MMNHPQWWLIVVAFGLGFVLTLTLMIRRVRREVPVGVSTVSSLSGAQESPTTEIPAGREESTTQIPIAQEPPTTKIPVRQEETTSKIPIALEPPTNHVPPGYDASSRIPAPQTGSTTLRRNRRWPWWALAAVFLVVGVAVAVTLTVTSHHRGASAPSSAPTPSAPPPVAVPALPGLLLSTEQIAETLGASNLRKGATAPSLVPDDGKGEIAEKDCLSAWTAGQHSVYANTGVTGAFTGLLMADETPMHHIADQSVIAYPTADAADKVVANQFAQWSACSGRTVTSESAAPQPPRLFTFGPVTNTSGILSMTQTSVDNPTWGCQRALAARSNVVIDIRACRPDTTNQAVDILNAIAAKIPH